MTIRPPWVDSGISTGPALWAPRGTAPTNAKTARARHPHNALATVLISRLMAVLVVVVHVLVTAGEPRRIP
jgi:hypothetical protein